MGCVDGEAHEFLERSSHVSHRGGLLESRDERKKVYTQAIKGKDKCQEKVEIKPSVVKPADAESLESN